MTKNWCRLAFVFASTALNVMHSLSLPQTFRLQCSFLIRSVVKQSATLLARLAQLATLLVNGAKLKWPMESCSNWSAETRSHSYWLITVLRWIPAYRVA